ncbi:hypothetical protein [Micromonospora tulbaghiae]|uniref:hypothetical protein n=1 Tax=Micromonospora tulbaghiae TaxID=479978 RepID=UPI0033F85980
MTARLRLLVARLPWTPRQFGQAATVGLLLAVAAVLTVDWVRSSRYGDRAVLVLALVIGVVWNAAVARAIHLLRGALHERRARR